MLDACKVNLNSCFSTFIVAFKFFCEAVWYIPYDDFKYRLIIFLGTCISNSECQDNQACKDYNCVDPCTTSCGQGADCRANNHVAICRCPRGNTGDPFQVNYNNRFFLHQM